MATLNSKKTQIENDLGNPEIYSDKTKFVALETAYNTVKNELTIANKQYEEIFEKIMEFEN